MRKTVWPLLALLVILHHDFWFWDDPTLVGGWFPVGLLYHVILSIVAAGFWLFAAKCAWPAELIEELALAGKTPSTAHATGAGETGADASGIDSDDAAEAPQS